MHSEAGWTYLLGGFYTCNVWIFGDTAHLGIQKSGTNMRAFQDSCVCFCVALITAVYSLPPEKNYLNADFPQIYAKSELPLKDLCL